MCLKFEQGFRELYDLINNPKPSQNDIEEIEKKVCSNIWFYNMIWPRLLKSWLALTKG